MPQVYTCCPKIEHLLAFGWAKDHFCVRVDHADGSVCSEVALTRDEATTMLSKLNPNLKESHL